MAERPGFYEFNGKVRRRNAEFSWNSGFAASQKQKNVANLHAALGRDKRCLEVSTKSASEFGRALSAHNLKLNGYPLENVYQSSKIFEKGGPYTDLLQMPPKLVKKDERLRSSGKLTGFLYEGSMFPLEPKSLFYDYIYCLAVQQCMTAEELRELLEYDCFTDIEFNPNKSISTQAEAIVVVRLLIRQFGEIPELNAEDFIRFYRSCH